MHLLSTTADQECLPAEEFGTYTFSPDAARVNNLVGQPTASRARTRTSRVEVRPWHRPAKSSSLGSN